MLKQVRKHTKQKSICRQRKRVLAYINQGWFQYPEFLILLDADYEETKTEFRVRGFLVGMQCILHNAQCT
jgi:hypothetical protein